MPTSFVLVGIFYLRLILFLVKSYLSTWAALRRVQNGDIFAVMMNDEYVISKEGVIEFFASDKAFRIYNKAEWHEKAVEYLWERLEKGA